MRHNRQATQTNWTTASQLAELGYCERKVVLEDRFGVRTSRARKAAQELGVKEHERYLKSAFHEQPSVISSCRPGISLKRNLTRTIWEWLFKVLCRRTEDRSRDV